MNSPNYNLEPSNDIYFNLIYPDKDEVIMNDQMQIMSNVQKIKKISEDEIPTKYCPDIPLPLSYKIPTSTRTFILFCFFILSIVSNIDSGIVPAAQTAFKQELSISDYEFSLLYSSTCFGNLFGNIILYFMFFKVDKKCLLLWFCIIKSISLCTVVCFDNYYTILAFLVISGICQNMFFIYPIVWVDQYIKQKKRGLMIAFVQLGINSGLSLGYFICYKMNLNWRLSLTIEGVTILSFSFLLIFAQQKYLKIINTSDSKKIKILKKCPTSIRIRTTSEKNLNLNFNKLNSEAGSESIKVINTEDTNQNTDNNDMNLTENMQANLSYKSSFNINESSSEVTVGKLCSFSSNNTNSYNNSYLNSEKVAGDNSSITTDKFYDKEITVSKLNSFVLNPGKLTSLKSIKLMLSQPVYLFTVISTATMCFTLGTLHFCISSYLEINYGVRKKQRNVTYTSLSVSGPTLGNLIGGIVGICIGGYEKKNTVVFCLVFNILAYLSILPSGLVHNIIFFCISIWGFYFFTGILIPLQVGIVLSSMPMEMRGISIILMSNVIILFGNIPPSLVFDALQKRYGSKKALIICSNFSFLGVIFILIALLFRYKQGKFSDMLRNSFTSYTSYSDDDLIMVEESLSMSVNEDNNTIFNENANKEIEEMTL